MGRSEHTFGQDDTWATPPEVFMPVLAALGVERFGLDPYGNPWSMVPTRVMVMLERHREEAAYAQQLYKSGAKWRTVTRTSRGGDEYEVELPVYRPASLDTEEIVWVADTSEELDWAGYGPVWCNGPTSACESWAKKTAGPTGGDEVVNLWPVRTASSWWQSYIGPQSDVHTFLAKRIQFLGAEWTAPWHNMLSYIGPNGDRFYEHIKTYGYSVRNEREWW